MPSNPSIPTQSADFDRVYRVFMTPWGDPRIPPQLKALLASAKPARLLELGCGVGRLSRFAAQQGIAATGVDFSPVAIAKARARVANDDPRPHFIVGDVTVLDEVVGPFGVSLDVGCFHCLDPEGQARYAARLATLLEPGATHLLWTLDHSPSDLALTPEAIAKAFAPHFALSRCESSRRRIAASHWSWLVKR